MEMIERRLIMDKNIKKVLALSVVAVFVLMFALQVVSAASGYATKRGVDDLITRPHWLVSLISFLGLGDTWALVVISIAVLVIIFAAAYGILEFTTFENSWVKLLIAAGIAVITGAVNGVTFIVGVLMAFAGGSIAIATVVAIGIAIVFFVMGSFFKGKMKHLQYKAKGEKVKDLLGLAAKVDEAKIDQAVGILKNSKK